MNNRVELAKFEIATKFEKKIDEVKSDHMKSITSLEMNLSNFPSYTPSSSSENINAYIMTQIILKSPGKPTQFTKYLSFMHLEGDTQLQIQKGWFSLGPEFYQFLFWQEFG